MQLQEYSKKRFISKWVVSYIYFNSTKIPDEFDLILNCHIDIIPWNQDQFTCVEKQGKIYGAWALDMKWNLTSALLAFKNHAKMSKKNIAIQFVTDEEIWWYNGTKYQLSMGIKSLFTITTEPTNFGIVYKAKGVYQFELTAKWTTYHSAYPWSGENAIENMLVFLNTFTKQFKNPDIDSWVTTYNVSEIYSPSQWYNKIPDICKVKIDLRFIPEDQEHIKQLIQELLTKNISICDYAFEPCFETDKNHKYIRMLQKWVEKYTWTWRKLYWANWTSDGRHFLKNAIEFWPIWSGIWSDKEWVDVQSLEDYYLILSDFIKNI